MDDYINLKCMELSTEYFSQKWHFTAHCRISKKSDSGKIGALFNTSMKITSKKSLVDILMIGPTFYPDLFSIITWFKKHKIAFSADIQKMCRQSLMSPSKRFLQTILWLNCESSENKTERNASLGHKMYSTSAQWKTKSSISIRTKKQRHICGLSSNWSWERIKCARIIAKTNFHF